MQIDCNMLHTMSIVRFERLDFTVIRGLHSVADKG